MGYGSTSAVHCRLHRGSDVEAPRDARDFRDNRKGRFNMQSKGKFGRRLGAIAAAAIMLAAFGGAEAMAASPRAAENKVVLIARQDPGTLDYVTSGLTALRLWIPANVVEPLVYFNKDGSVEPGVAESWTCLLYTSRCV